VTLMDNICWNLCSGTGLHIRTKVVVVAIHTTTSIKYEAGVAEVAVGG
jgi:hypothetical protein